MLATSHHAARASLLVKVIQVPRDAESDEEAFEGLVSSIVQGTNWQNKIRNLPIWCRMIVARSNSNSARQKGGLSLPSESTVEK